ncbi:hypothetical protein GCM10011506_13470 [Marivirga lumbricoides]|uniref:Arsenate reductase n=1 Tax=Marivirga lumbricoides TaxID=1046115 RepID=A0A2T4DSD0_9BACT|nr:hypothetical protein C9994_06600 [Marivirga lumbricoides]GGC29375.1 hypothetical protein GCM10011506_13470 [Marivirga lumbricoides]
MEHKKKIEMELKFIYNSNQLKEREALAYIKSLDKHVINELDVHKMNITESQLADLARKLDVEVAGLLDEEKEYYQDNLKGKDLSENDILGIIASHPEVLKTPIVSSHESATFVGSSYDFNNIDLEFSSNKGELSNPDEKDN